MHAVTLVVLDVCHQMLALYAGHEPPVDNERPQSPPSKVKSPPRRSSSSMLVSDAFLWFVNCVYDVRN